MAPIDQTFENPTLSVLEFPAPARNVTVFEAASGLPSSYTGERKQTARTVAGKVIEWSQAEDVVLQVGARSADTRPYFLAAQLPRSEAHPHGIAFDGARPYDKLYDRLVITDLPADVDGEALLDGVRKLVKPEGKVSIIKGDASFEVEREVFLRAMTGPQLEELLSGTPDSTETLRGMHTALEEIEKLDAERQIRKVREGLAHPGPPRGHLSLVRNPDPAPIAA